MTISDNDKVGITAVIERYRAGFASMDPDLLLSIWDQLHDSIVCIVQEKDEPMRGWTQIEAYYRALPAAIPTDRVIEMRVHDLTIDTLGDVALALCRFHLEGETAAQGEPFIADGRVTFAMHRTQGSWKVTHHHESAPPDHTRDR